MVIHTTEHLFVPIITFSPLVLKKGHSLYNIVLHSALVLFVCRLIGRLSPECTVMYMDGYMDLIMKKSNVLFVSVERYLLKIF